MEEVLAAFAGQARKSGDSQNTQDFVRPPKHTSFNKNLIRKKSIFTLAAELFKPKKDEKVEVPTLEYEKQGGTRVPWNSFVSLRGFRESKKRASIFGSVRCRSSSPRKTNELVIDEFGMPKTMRRKSLQDLLGTVGTKLSLARRLVYNEDSIPQTEAPLGATTQFQDVSSLVLPEPALPLQRPSNTVLGSLCHYCKESTPNETPSFYNSLEINRRGEEASSGRPKLRTKPSLRVINVAAQPPNAVNRLSPPRRQGKSQELKQITSSPSPEMPCPPAPSECLQDVRPQIPMRDRFVDKEIPPQYRYSNDFEDTNAPESANLDPSFPGRALSRKARYNTISGGPSSEQTESSTRDIERPIALTAARLSKNLHLSTSQSRWSVDSSETGTDDMSDYTWVEKEMEVQEIIGRGKEIMTLGTLSPHLHSSDTKVHIMESQGTRVDEQSSSLRNGAFSPRFDSCVYVQECPASKEDWVSSVSYLMRPMVSDEPVPELPISESLNMVNDELQEIDKFKTQTVSCNVDRGRQRVIPLENGQRFRPRRVNSRIISGEPVHIVYPPSESCAGHTKMYTSKSSAFRDLYQNHSGFSDYCLFDRSTRTYYPQAYFDPVPELPQSNAEMLEVLWLPLEIFPEDSLTAPFDGEDDCLSPSDERVAEVVGPSCHNTNDLPNSDSSSLQSSDVNNSKNEAFNDGEIPILVSSPRDSAYSEQGSWLGYNEPAPHVDMEGMSSYNYTMTLISTREVASSTTGSLASGDPQPELEDMDPSYEIAIDSATARRYLGSLFSSTESLNSIEEAEVGCSKSAESIWDKLGDAQPEDAKHIKTWIEMECEFLDKFAPGSHMFPDRRRRVAVYEALKKLKGLADTSDDGALNSSGPELFNQDLSDTEHRKWLQYRKAYMGFDFEHVEDIADSGSIKEESSVTENSSYVKEGANLSISADPNVIGDARDKGKDSVKASHRAYAPVREFATFRDDIRDMLVEQQAEYSESSTTEGMSKSNNFGASRTNGGQKSAVINGRSHNRPRSEADSDTDSTGITMLSGYMFTHYAEQLGECPAEVQGKEKQHCAEEHDDQRILPGLSHKATDVAPSISVFEDPSMQPPTELLENDAGGESDTDQLNIWHKNESVGLARAMTVQLCQPATRVGLAALFPGRSTFLNIGRFNSAETLNTQTPAGPRLMTQKRVPTPKKRAPSPSTEFSPQKSQALRCISPSPSVADTEVSENFGQKLKRYKGIEEEDKENDFWWTDSISYG